MLSSVVGLVSHDMAIDLGTSHTRIRLKDDDSAFDEPTALAIASAPQGEMRVTATGGDAHRLSGKAPQGIEVVRPVRSSRIHNYDIANIWIQHLVHRVHGRRRFVRPDVVVAAPPLGAPSEAVHLRETLRRAGARRVRTVPRALAASLGAGLPHQANDTWLVVDMGGGGVEAAVIQGGHVIDGQHIPAGGDAMDEAIVSWFARHHAIDIGPQTAERIKRTMASAFVEPQAARKTIHGRCRRRHLPVAGQVAPQHVHMAIEPLLTAIATMLRSTLERLPADLQASLLRRGIALTGGASRIRHIEPWLHQRVGLPVRRLEHPTTATVSGLQAVLRDRRLRRFAADL